MVEGGKKDKKDIKKAGGTEEVKIKRFDINNEFLDMVRAVERIKDDITLIFEKDKIVCQQVDPAHVSMVYNSLPSHSFSIYEGFNGEHISFDIKLFKRVMESIGKKGIITIDGDKIKIKNGRNEGVIAVEDIVGEIPKIPNLEYEVTGVINAKQLLKIIHNSNSDYLTFIADNNELKVMSNGDISNILVYLGTCNGKGRASYSCEYLETIIGFYKDDIKISFSTDKPMLISNGRISYLLAPRIEE